MKKKDKATKVYHTLNGLYLEASCSLNYENPLQLLIATQLAAQCTDERVNQVTPILFERYKTVSDFANANIEELESIVRSTGFYRNKAKNIKGCCAQLIERFDGEVPSEMEKLLTLPGVGRKTANVILGECFGIPGIVVDTHAGRLSRRIGLTAHEDPAKVEIDLMKILDPDKWQRFCHLLIAHGRETCRSRSPKCQECLISEFCSFKKK